MEEDPRLEDEDEDIVLKRLSRKRCEATSALIFSGDELYLRHMKSPSSAFRDQIEEKEENTICPWNDAGKSRISERSSFLEILPSLSNIFSLGSRSAKNKLFRRRGTSKSTMFQSCGSDEDLGGLSAYLHIQIFAAGRKNGDAVRQNDVLYVRDVKTSTWLSCYYNTCSFGNKCSILDSYASSSSFPKDAPGDFTTLAPSCAYYYAFKLRMPFISSIQIDPIRNKEKDERKLVLNSVYEKGGEGDSGTSSSANSEELETEELESEVDMDQAMADMDKLTSGAGLADSEKQYFEESRPIPWKSLTQGSVMELEVYAKERPMQCAYSNNGISCESGNGGPNLCYGVVSSSFVFQSAWEYRHEKNQLPGMCGEGMSLFLSLKSNTMYPYSLTHLPKYQGRFVL